MKRLAFSSIVLLGLMGLSHVLGSTPDSSKANQKISVVPIVKNDVQKSDLSNTESHAIVVQKSENAEGIKSKITLGDASISQTFIRVSLQKPSTIFLYNMRGQLLYRMDSQRQMEILPLQGIQAGFLYVSIRSGKEEFTKKLIFTGK